MIRLHAFFVAAVALFAAALVSVPVAPASAHTEFQDFGRYNSNRHTLACPAGSYVVGFQGRSGDLIDQITVRCAPLMGTTFQHGTAVPAGHGGGFGGGAFGVHDCGPSQAVGGLAWQVSRDEHDAGQEGFVDMFGVTCRELAPPYNRGGFLKVYSNDDPGAFSNNWMVMQHEFDPPLYNFDYVGKPANLTDAVSPHGFAQQCPADELATAIKFASGVFIDAVALICDAAPTAVAQTPAPAPAPPPLPAAPAGAVAGFDRPGSDYFSFASANPANCQLSCQKDTTCAAWSWAAAGTHGVPNATCYMKRPTAPAAKADACCISGTRTAEVAVDAGAAKPDAGIDFSGAWDTMANGQKLAVTLTQDAKGNVTGSYPGGTITNGVVIGSQLRATWTEGSRTGRLRFNILPPAMTTIEGRYNNVLTKEPSLNDKPWGGSRAGAGAGASGSASAGANFAGTWQTTINGSTPGSLTLTGSGSAWSGTYSGAGITGKIQNGSIGGDGHLRVAWKNSGGATGKVDFKLTGVHIFHGTFYFDSNPAAVGSWDGH
jgi:hypothetical protein